MLLIASLNANLTSMGSPGQITFIFGRVLKIAMSSIEWCDDPKVEYDNPDPVPTIMTGNSSDRVEAIIFSN